MKQGSSAKKDQAVVTASFEIKNHNMLESYLKEIEVDFREMSRMD